MVEDDEVKSVVVWSVSVMVETSVVGEEEVNSVGLVVGPSLAKVVEMSGVEVNDSGEMVVVPSLPKVVDPSVVV